MNTIKKIQLLNNTFTLREMLDGENNKEVILIDEGGRNKNSTNNNEKSNETCRTNLLNVNFDKPSELTKDIDHYNHNVLEKATPEDIPNHELDNITVIVLMTQ